MRYGDIGLQVYRLIPVQAALSDEIRINTTITCLKNVLVDGKPTIELMHGESVEKFDWCINCTYNQISRVSTACFYEVCLTLVYEQIDPSQDIVGITIMDGEFCSLYPYVLSEADYLSGRRRYTLTHVRHTPVFASKLFEEAKAYLDEMNDELVRSRVPLFENAFSFYYPSFQNEYKFVEWFASIKTKPVDSGAVNHAASRECVAEVDGRVVNVLSGKINTLFEAERKVLSILLNSWSQRFANPEDRSNIHQPVNSR